MSENMHKIDLFAKCTIYWVKYVPKNVTCIQKSTQSSLFIHFFTDNQTSVSFSMQNKKFPLFQ